MGIAPRSKDATRPLFQRLCLPAEAAPMTGEKKNDVAGCSNEDAAEVAIVAAEKRPRPQHCIVSPDVRKAGKGGVAQPAYKCNSPTKMLLQLLLTQSSINNCEISFASSMQLGSAQMLLRKSQSIWRPCHVRRKMVL